MSSQVVEKIIDRMSYSMSKIKLFTVSNLASVLNYLVELLIDILNEVLSGGFKQ